MDFNELYDEDEDEFLFQSITRYNTLQMFNLENIPHHLLPFDDSSICVGSQRLKGENSELLKLKLPTKLTLPPEEEGRSKENDFKVLSGVYTENLLHQIDKLSNKIIASDNKTNGLLVYSFADFLLGTSKSQEQKLNVTPWSRFNFTVVAEKKHAICCKSSREPLIEVDVTTGEKLREIENPFHKQKNLPQIGDNAFISNNIKVKTLDSNSVAILNTLNGCVVPFDLRTNNKNFITLNCESNNNKEIWNLSGYDFNESSFNYFGVVSSRKSFCVYDKRKNAKIINNSGNIPATENNNKMTMKFNKNGDRFTISGMNSFVEVYETQNSNFNHVFTHNGHCPKNLPEALVTDHMWIQTGGNEYIVSVCKNGTLNCWDYNT